MNNTTPLKSTITTSVPASVQEIIEAVDAGFMVFWKDSTVPAVMESHGRHVVYEQGEDGCRYNFEPLTLDGGMTLSPDLKSELNDFYIVRPVGSAVPTITTYAPPSMRELWKALDDGLPVFISSPRWRLFQGSESVCFRDAMNGEETALLSGVEPTECLIGLTYEQAKTMRAAYDASHEGDAMLTAYRDLEQSPEMGHPEFDYARSLMRKALRAYGAANARVNRVNIWGS